MSVTESIWAMVNLTLSALAVIWLTASYAKVAFQKTNKRANLLLLGYAAFLTGRKSQIRPRNIRFPPKGKAG